jgi:hypothetical protein
LLKIWRGIRGGNAKCSCIVCTLPNDGKFMQFKDMDCPLRKCDVIDRSICQDELPFFAFVDTDHIVLPGLHIFLGIVLQIILIIFMELRRLEFQSQLYEAGQGNEITEGVIAEDDDEVLEELQKKLENAEELAKEWSGYIVLYEASDGNNTTDSENIDEESEEESEASDEEDDVIPCAASNCVVKKTGETLPDRPSHGVLETPNMLKCNTTKEEYHTICAGLSAEEARKTPKRKYVYSSVTDAQIMQTITDEVTIAHLKGKPF